MSEPGGEDLSPIVPVEWLIARLSGTAGHTVIADVRWYLDGRSGLAAFEAGHIPGARWVDIDTDLSDHDQPATEGRHPLPSPAQFAAAMSRLGIGDHTTVIAYDDSGGGTAGRLVVMLRSIGRSAALLDGGLKAWPGELESGAADAPVPAAFTAVPWPQERFASIDDAAAAARSENAVVLDARSADRFRGEVEPVDPRAGHVPGAQNAPWAANLDASGRFLSGEKLRERFAALGVEPGTDVICYCGSGVSACANVLAMEHAGLPAPRLFVASWSGWSSDPGRPVEC
jgi:thiosulfate/3-mercaptopyruvate sulfurtransferase